MTSTTEWITSSNFRYFHVWNRRLTGLIRIRYSHENGSLKALSCYFAAHFSTEGHPASFICPLPTKSPYWVWKGNRYSFSFHSVSLQSVPSASVLDNMREPTGGFPLVSSSINEDSPTKGGNRFLSLQDQYRASSTRLEKLSLLHTVLLDSNRVRYISICSPHSNYNYKCRRMRL